MSPSPKQAAARCFLFLALTTGITHALDTWASQPAGGGGQGVLETPEDAAGGKARNLACGEKTDPFDIPVGPHTAVAASHDPASFLLAATQLYAEIGLGRPNCNDSNCGIGQTCPSKGGSQTISGGVKADWRTPFSRFVDLDIQPDTQGIQTCANCS